MINSEVFGEIQTEIKRNSEVQYQEKFRLKLREIQKIFRAIPTHTVTQ